MFMDWIRVFLMSQGAARRIAKSLSWKLILPIFLLALFVVSIPENYNNPNRLVSDLAYNLQLLGGTLIGIFLVLTLLLYISSGFKESLSYLLKRVIVSSSIILILNGLLTLIIFVILDPLGLDQIALALTATLVSTYYVIVAITVVLPTEKFPLYKQVFVELVSLALWYAFSFIVLPMTL